MSREGSVKRDRSGRWGFVVDLAPAGASRRRQVRKRGFRTKAEALEELQKVQHENRQGTYVAPSKQTFRAFVDEWLVAIRPTVRPSTWASYERNMRVHVLPAVGSTPLQAVDAGQLGALYARLLDDGHQQEGKGLSARTVAYIGTIVHRALKDAVLWGRLARNPADVVARPKAASSARKVAAWDASTLSTFLEKSRTYEGKGKRPDRYRAVWTVLATTGMRRGEVLGLRWSDLDLDVGVASISQTIISVEHEVLVGTPKTAMGARSVDLDSTTISVLREHRKAQLEERLLMGAGFTDRGLVFCLPDGSPYDPERVSREFSRRVTKWGLPTLTLHGLRHTWATLALRAGVHPKVVQERLGHSTVSITLNIYSHVSAGMQREAADKVAALIYGTSAV